MDRDLVLVLVCDFAERITQPIRKGNIISGVCVCVCVCFAPHYAIRASTDQRKQKGKAEITSALLRFSLQKLLHIEITPNYPK